MNLFEDKISKNKKSVLINSFREIVNDKAIIFGMSNKIWIFLSAALTAPLILIFFSPALQGYYYTFNSLLGIQTLFVMGLGQLIQQFVSHEWAKINYTERKRFSGDKSAIQRLAAIKQFTVKWFSWMSATLLLGLSIGGYLFLKHSSSNNVVAESVWLAPWVLICILKSIQIFISPGFTFLDGINEVEAVNKFRFSQSIYERIASWIVMIIGGKLWLFTAGTGINLIGQFNFLGRKFYKVLREIFSLKAPPNKIWKEEIFPLQWKYAISSISGYLNFMFIIPLIFWFLGPVEAGKLGITWAVITMFWGLSVTLISTKMPAFAMNAAKMEFKTLNSSFLKSTMNSTIFLSLMIIIFIAGLLFLELIFPSIAKRFLSFLPALLISLAIIPHHLRFAMASYMRALKREPFWKISILDIILVLVFLPLLCKLFGIIGVSIGFLLIVLINALLTYFVFVKLNKSLTGF